MMPTNPAACDPRKPEWVYSALRIGLAVVIQTTADNVFHVQWGDFPGSFIAKLMWIGSGYVIAFAWRKPNV